MPRPIVSMMIIFVLLLFGSILLALRSCESPSSEQQGPIEYPNEETTSETVSEPTIQYSNDLPPTGGVRLW